MKAEVESRREMKRIKKLVRGLNIEVFK